MMLGKYNIANWHIMNTKIFQRVSWFQLSISNKYISFAACNWTLLNFPSKSETDKKCFFSKKRKQIFKLLSVWYLSIFHSIFQFCFPGKRNRKQNGKMEWKMEKLYQTHIDIFLFVPLRYTFCQFYFCWESSTMEKWNRK